MQDGRAEKLTLTACHESILVLPYLKSVEEKYINLQKYLFYLTGKLQNLTSDKLLVTQKESFKKHLLSKENAKTKLHHLTNNIQGELLRKYRGLLLGNNSKTWIFFELHILLPFRYVVHILTTVNTNNLSLLCTLKI